MQRRCCCPPDIPRALFFRRSLTSSQIAASRRDFSTTHPALPWNGYRVFSDRMQYYHKCSSGTDWASGIPFPHVYGEDSRPYLRKYSPVKLYLSCDGQPSTRSFIRFKDFRSVDLPQPLGPINAVISFSGISILISFRA